MQTINCFLPYVSPEQVKPIVEELWSTGLVNKIYLLAPEGKQVEEYDGCTILPINTLTSTSTLRTICEHADGRHVLLYTRTTPLKFGQYGLERMISAIEIKYTDMVYADHYKVCNGVKQAHPLIDCQLGSVRDDFDFGPLLLISYDALERRYGNLKRKIFEFKYAGLYSLWILGLFMNGIFHIREYLYAFEEEDIRESGEKQFDYVNPQNREAQEEMELVCTNWLTRMGCKLKKKPSKVKIKKRGFPCEASVIIPVRNRVRTIEDAIRSVFMQQATFKFNLIIVDNHSTDGTTEVIDRYASDERLIHLIPERDDLGIGGCWNEAAAHPQCGKFCVQLDSDDVYSGPDTLQKIVDTFYQENCAMVIGTYKTTDFDLNEIPPGIVDHREWTEMNGRNNALRINGLGAPRAFYTPVLRELKMPNVSYGEDYAIGLMISRTYHIGRIYDVLYLCRRWEDNTDAALDIHKINENNAYKDSLRTLEITTRRDLVRMQKRK